jgi:hypothetical protein
MYSVYIYIYIYIYIDIVFLSLSIYIYIWGDLFNRGSGTSQIRVLARLVRLVLANGVLAELVLARVALVASCGAGGRARG